jgi:hypothetical protein
MTPALFPPLGQISSTYLIQFLPSSWQTSFFMLASIQMFSSNAVRPSYTDR